MLTLIDEFAEGGGHRITFTGGEPLTYPDLEQVLSRSHNRGLRVRLFSSGVVFEGDERLAGRVLLQRFAPLLDTVMFSLYAAAPEAHDRITYIPGSFHLTLEAVKCTVELGIRAELHFVPTQVNYRELPAVVALAADLGISRVGILRFVPHGRGKSKAAALTLDREAHLWLRQCVLELRSRYPEVALTTGSAYNLLALDGDNPCTAGLSQ